MPTAPCAPPDQARLFLALWPAPGLQTALLAYQNAWQWPGRTSLVPAQKLHLTLHFMGAVPRQQIADISRSLAVPVAPFEVEWGRPALWEGGVAVLEPLAAPSALLQLRERLGLALQQLGLPVENRPFRPHVTLARHAAGAGAPASVQPLHWPVEGYALVESASGRYQVLQRYA